MLKISTRPTRVTLGRLIEANQFEHSSESILCRYLACLWGDASSTSLSSEIYCLSWHFEILLNFEVSNVLAFSSCQMYHNGECWAYSSNLAELSNCVIMADAKLNLITFRCQSKPNFDVKGRLISNKRARPAPFPRSIYKYGGHLSHSRWSQNRTEWISVNFGVVCVVIVGTVRY